MVYVHPAPDPGILHPLMSAFPASLKAPFRMLALLTAVGVLAPSTVRAEVSAPPARTELYHAIHLQRNGAISPETLESAERLVHVASGQIPPEVFVLIHGFNTSESAGRMQYRAIARRLRTYAGKQQVPVVVVGVHWNSHPGPISRWLPRMLAYRLATVAGFKNAFRNPYLQKVKAAKLAGRRGVRSLVRRIAEEVPPDHIHVLAHSLGSEVTVQAVGSGPVPTRTAAGPTPAAPIPPLGLVALAGADLDHDVFTGKSRSIAQAALTRARVWWLTCPPRKSADGVLELRRSAGRRDAVGNIGLSLPREDLDRLLGRRGVVFDDDRIPIGHDILHYYDAQRIEKLVTSVRYLRTPRPDSPSVLARLDRILQAPVTDLDQPLEPGTPLAARMYVRWRLYPNLSAYGPIRITTPL